MWTCTRKLERNHLLNMSHGELEALFRASPTGPITMEEGEGTAISGQPVIDVFAKLAHLIASKGK
jgi:hypothetical protein